MVAPVTSLLHLPTSAWQALCGLLVLALAQQACLMVLHAVTAVVGAPAPPPLPAPPGAAKRASTEAECARGVRFEGFDSAMARIGTSEAAGGGGSTLVKVKSGFKVRLTRTWFCTNDTCFVIISCCS